MNYIVYQTTNKINDKIYIGVHKTDNFHDEYLGSSTLLARAISKYGMESFERETLFEFDNPTEAYEKERQLVNKDFISRVDTYNLKEGGIGGAGPRSQETKNKISNAWKDGRMKPRKQSDATKEKLRKIALAQSPLTEEQKLKHKLACKGELNGFYGKKHDSFSVAKMKLGAKNRPKITCPHCDRLVDKCTSKRWHFDNCKLK